MWPCTQRRDGQLPRPHPWSTQLSQMRGISLSDGCPKRSRLEIHRFPGFFPLVIGVLARRPSCLCLTCRAGRRDRHLGLQEGSRLPCCRPSAAGEWGRGEGSGPQTYLTGKLLIPWYPEGRGTRGPGVSPWLDMGFGGPLGHSGPFGAQMKVTWETCGEHSWLGQLLGSSAAGEVTGKVMSRAKIGLDPLGRLVRWGEVPRTEQGPPTPSGDSALPACTGGSVVEGAPAVPQACGEP